MFVPNHYEGDPAAALAVVRANPLATLVTSADPVPFATHLPVVVPRETDLALRDGPQDLVGRRLIGHLNRANPHWSRLADGATSGLLIFRGPGGYISPTVYGYTPASPTWNFVSVHVQATITPLPAGEQTLGVVRRTVEELEGRFGHGWDMTDSLGYFEQIVPGVGAFEIAVEKVEGMFKLSQELAGPVREGTIHHFGSSSQGTHRELACWMERFTTDQLPETEGKV